MDDLATLRARSRTLERRFKQLGYEKKQLDAALVLIRDAAQAGEIVGKFEDRRLLQGIMDYWASILRIAMSSTVSGSEMSEPQDIFVAPPLAPFAQSDKDEDGLTRITLDVFLQLVDRHDYINARKLRNAIVPPDTQLLVQLMDSQFQNCTLTRVRFAPNSRFITAGFIRCQLDDLTARDIQFIDSRFISCNLEHADFRKSDFSRALIRHCNFDDRTHFFECTFASARLQYVTGNGVIFRKAEMGSSELSNSMLTNCDFTDAELKDAKLWDSNFQGSSFIGASLKSADLDRAIFRKCKLKGANFEGASNIERADFTDCNWREARFDSLAAKDLAQRYPTPTSEPVDVPNNVSQFPPTGTKD